MADCNKEKMERKRTQAKKEKKRKRKKKKEKKKKKKKKKKKNALLHSRYIRVRCGMTDIGDFFLLLLGSCLSCEMMSKRRLTPFSR